MPFALDFESLHQDMEKWIETLISSREDDTTSLIDGMRYAVFPAGKRIRSKLCIASTLDIAHQNNIVLTPNQTTLLLRSAAAIELVHCASLVHDDLPIFDNSNLRRNKPSTHIAFGQPLALLIGDALISLAYFSLLHDIGLGQSNSKEKKTGISKDSDESTCIYLLRILSESLLPPSGIIAGQAMEECASVDIVEYHRRKSATLFSASVKMALAIVDDGTVPDSHTEKWNIIGESIGMCYQSLDDAIDRHAVKDAKNPSIAIGKDLGKDRELDRPSSARLNKDEDTLAIENGRKSLKAALSQVVDISSSHTWQIAKQTIDYGFKSLR